MGFVIRKTANRMARVKSIVFPQKIVDVPLNEIESMPESDEFKHQLRSVDKARVWTILAFLLLVIVVASAAAFTSDDLNASRVNGMALSELNREQVLTHEIAIDADSSVLFANHKDQYIQDLQSHLAEWRSYHDGMVFGDAKNNMVPLDVSNTAVLQKAQSSYEDMLQAANTLLFMPDTKETQDALRSLQRGTGPYIQALDAISVNLSASQYQHISHLILLAIPCIALFFFSLIAMAYIMFDTLRKIKRSTKQLIYYDKTNLWQTRELERQNIQKEEILHEVQLEMHNRSVVATTVRYDSPREAEYEIKSRGATRYIQMQNGQWLCQCIIFQHMHGCFHILEALRLHVKNNMQANKERSIEHVADDRMPSHNGLRRVAMESFPPAGELLREYHSEQRSKGA